MRIEQGKKGGKEIERVCSEAPKPITPVRCRLRLDPVPSQRVALPWPPPFLPSSLLPTHLCSAGRNIMSPKNPLRSTSLSEQATITQSCQVLPY